MFVWKLTACVLGAVAVVGWFLAFRFCLMAMDLERRLENTEDELLQRGIGARE